MATGATNLSVKGLGDGEQQWLAPMEWRDKDGNVVASIAATGAIVSVSSVTANSVNDAAGAVALASTLSVAGATTLSAAATVGTTLGVTGASTLTGAVTASAALSVGTLFKLAGIETGLTANAGGTQAAALALSTTKAVHNVTVVGTDADSVKLPASAGAGAVHIVMNSDAAQSIQVFGSGTDTINGVLTTTGVALAAGKSAIFVDYAAGTWFMLLGA